MSHNATAKQSETFEYQCTHLIRRLYLLVQSDENRAEYNEWMEHFQYLHGTLDTQRRTDTVSLTNRYNIEITDADDIFKVVFAIESCYSIILRLLAFKAIGGKTESVAEAFTSDFFLSEGILNYSCPDYYNWFLYHDLVPCYTGLFVSIDINVVMSNDDFAKALFEDLFPREIRHSLGEYYTPSWIARYVVEEISKNSLITGQETYLDPACGSGAFLTQIIKMHRQANDLSVYSRVFGIDINPLSVLAAKTYFLMQCLVDRLVSKTSQLNIPVYCADAISAVSEDGKLFSSLNSPLEHDNLPRVDFIVGNPPWVNWEYLPKRYRESHAHIWRRYNLLNSGGYKSAFVKEDISVLFTYAVIDRYLKVSGKLGFLVKDTLLKSPSQGAGFRRFRLDSKRCFAPYQVDDLTALKLFADATTRTAVLFVENSKHVEYPVKYTVWRPSNRDCLRLISKHESALDDAFRREVFYARPSNPSDSSSGWIVDSEQSALRSKRVLGDSAYTARIGVFTGGANAIFHLGLVGTHDGVIRAQNQVQRAKNKVEAREFSIESTHVYPLLTGKDLDFWAYSYDRYILCPHTAESRMQPVSAHCLAKLPLTSEYLHSFEKELTERKGFTSFDKKIHEMAFYSLQRIGRYTFAPYKVAWRFISSKFTVAVVEMVDDPFLGVKDILPNDKIVFVGLANRDEAYYLCGLLSSQVYRHTIESFMVGTQISPSVLQRLNIPAFDSGNEGHISISRACFHGHRSPIELRQGYLETIEALVRDMLGI